MTPEDVGAHLPDPVELAREHRCPFCRNVLKKGAPATLEQCGGNEVARAPGLPARQWLCEAERCPQASVIVTLREDL